MRKFVSLCLLILIPFQLVSCSQKSYRDDISCKKISSELLDEANLAGEYDRYTQENIDFLFGDSSLYDDFSVIYSIDTNDINEIGIFHCSDEEKTKSFLTIVENYIKEQQENQKAFIASYAPREVPKLEAAKADRYGNYVIYTILDENIRHEIFEEAEDILKK